MSDAQDERSSGSAWLAGSIFPVLTGLAASAVLTVDYLRPMPVFCSEGGGCDAVKHTALATPFGIPMPLFGLVGFILLGLATVAPGRPARRIQAALASVAGLAGLLLIAVQVRIGHFCPYCCIADGSGIVAAVLAFLRLGRFDETRAPAALLAYAGGTAMVAAVALPLVGGFRATPGVPQVIRDEIARTPSGEVTVVDFVDFECPFCRMTHAELEPIVEEHTKQLRVVRHQVPLRMHPHAMDAARAACCGERLGKGDAMTNALFTAPVEDLTPEGCEKIAAGVGLPVGAYRACVGDPATDKAIEADKSVFQAAGGYALPTIWIDRMPIVGSQPREVLANAIETALGRPSGG